MSYTHNGAEQQLQLDLDSAVSSRSGVYDAPLHFCAKKHTVPVVRQEGGFRARKFVCSHHGLLTMGAKQSTKGT